MLQKGCYSAIKSAKTIVAAILRKFIPLKYTRYTVTAPPPSVEDAVAGTSRREEENSNGPGRDGGTQESSHCPILRISHLECKLKSKYDN